ncbi:MAG TPA: phosphoglucosamine mutase [Candidatus Limnocylindrales bacterium]|nr:phosphoglucosamine mutase [Candidatus Limnocylindrales bacterium]
MTRTIAADDAGPQAPVRRDAQSGSARRDAHSGDTHRDPENGGSRRDPESRRLFGTDGIRGVANEEPMTPETVLRLGRAVGQHFLTSGQRRHKIVIGKDTRLSGYMLETALAAGITSMGVDVLLVGPMPTPGIAFLTRSFRADAGVAISASHNPFHDNGIKFFGPDGFKLADAAECAIEKLVFGDSLDRIRPTGRGIGKAFRIDDADGRYNVFLKNVLPRELTLEGLRVVVDCAHGAAYKIAPTVLSELGADVIAMGVSPDGHNINDGVGALHVGGLCDRVRAEKADVGIALDGDADRCIMVDERGDEVDGDHVLAILGLAMQARGELAGGTVVATVMSNFGLEVALRERGITLERTPVGDRYVVERMIAGGFRLGGEKSGHIICLDHATTGDGMVTALSVLTCMKLTGKTLSEGRSLLRSFPQRLVSLKVRERRSLESIPAVVGAIAEAEEALGGRGRVVVRFSGTEPLARVMVEGEEEGAVERHAQRIAAAIEAALG